MEQHSIAQKGKWRTLKDGRPILVGGSVSRRGGSGPRATERQTAYVGDLLEKADLSSAYAVQGINLGYVTSKDKTGIRRTADYGDMGKREILVTKRVLAARFNTWRNSVQKGNDLSRDEASSFLDWATVGTYRNDTNGILRGFIRTQTDDPAQYWQDLTGEARRVITKAGGTRGRAIGTVLADWYSKEAAGVKQLEVNTMSAPLLQHLSTPDLVEIKSLLDSQTDGVSVKTWALIIKEVAQRAGAWATSEDEKDARWITVKAHLETILRDVDTLNVEDMEEVHA